MSNPSESDRQLLRSTIEASYQRQRAILHLILGDEDWEPTQTDIASIRELWEQAEAGEVKDAIAKHFKFE